MKRTGAGDVKIWELDIKGLLRRNSTVYMPDNPVIRAELLQTNYNNLLEGYFSISKTLEIL